MPRYDYSRVPAELFATLGREYLFEGPGAIQRWSRALEAVKAAALVPERTRAELAEALLAQMEVQLEPAYTGSIEFGDVRGGEIRALVNEARSAPRTPPNETKVSVAQELAEYCERAAKNPYADTPFDSAVLYVFADRYRRAT